MNANAKKWVRALRSGKYKRTTGRLRDGNRFCCLGVACDLAIKAGIPVRLTHKYDVLYRYDRSDSYLPAKVREWLGLTDKKGSYGDGIFDNLASKNDEGKTFGQIANIIERQADRLFR